MLVYMKLKVQAEIKFAVYDFFRNKQEGFIV